MEKTIGGDRLGSGNKNKVWMRNYERSTHDLSYIWKSTMAAGTLVPFMSEVALPGDTFDIDLDVDVLTHPTVGPLFGTYKIQLDVFQIPIRLYQAKLHQNMLGIGMDMSKVTLPKIVVAGAPLQLNQTLDNQQVNPSSLLAYLGIRGCGYNPDNVNEMALRAFNGIPYLGYWDIYKNYYANKQEEFGAFIHKNIDQPLVEVTDYRIIRANPDITVLPTAQDFARTSCMARSTMIINGINITENTSPSDFRIEFMYPNGEHTNIAVDKLFSNWMVQPQQGRLIGENPQPFLYDQSGWGNITVSNQSTNNNPDKEPEVVTFPLDNIDKMRSRILAHLEEGTFYIDRATEAPYGSILYYNNANQNYNKAAFQHPQEGLALKTYNSDLFNNWISTEWIDGPDGISAITAIDTTEGSFTIDELNLSKKIYNMLNRIALSGGSYDDWLDAVYTHERQRSAENPIYLGGLISKLVFQEVVSNSKSDNQPLGTLAGRGRIGGKQKGGKIVAKVDEPSYIMGIVSLTPNIDYSQGNKWDMSLETLNDFHKPALDEIGFQDLSTDQMAWFDTAVPTGAFKGTFRSAGKQPAWINYMTNVNVVRGNFADQNQQMFMTLNRRYGVHLAGNKPTIADLTTYIDPTKFNHIFADTRRDAQNFWTQIAVNIEARRKMSAKVIPNL